MENQPIHPFQILYANCVKDGIDTFWSDGDFLVPIQTFQTDHALDSFVESEGFRAVHWIEGTPENVLPIERV